MKRTTFLVIVSLMILMIGLAVGCASRKWEPYESKDGWFRADFPGRPVVETMPLATAAGNINIHMVSVTRRNGAYGVGYVDFPEVKTDVNMESDEFIESMARGSFSTIGTGDYTKKKITFEGYPGLEAEGDVRSGSARGRARLRYYVVEKRIYILEVIGENSFVNSSNTDKFFNSFKLIYEDEK